MIFSALFRVWVEIFGEEKLNFWRRCVFKNFWNHSYAFQIMKTGYELYFCRKFRVFQKFWVLGFLIDKKKIYIYIYIFRPKLTLSFDSCLIGWTLFLKHFYNFSIPLDQSNVMFFKVFKKNQISFSKFCLPFDSSRFLYIQKNFFFFGSFPSQKLKDFYLHTRYDSFILSFWLIYMHFA